MIETATGQMSIALMDGQSLVAAVHRTVGRGHAEQLLPAIASLPNGGLADEIWVGCGPGSFTGLRIGIAAAKALGFAWNVDVKGFNTIDLVALQAARHAAVTDIAIVMDGGHGEWLAAEYRDDGYARMRDPLSMSPKVAADALMAFHVAGERAADLVALRGFGAVVPADADARFAGFLEPQQLIVPASPVYARQPDATMTRPAT